MNTVKRFSLSGVLVAFVAALLLSGSLLLATTQNAYAEEFDVNGQYLNRLVNTASSDNFPGQVATLGVYKINPDGTTSFIGHAACIEPEADFPRDYGPDSTWASISTYANESTVDHVIQRGSYTLSDADILKMKKIVYIYSKTNKLDDFFKNAEYGDLGKYQVAWAAISHVSGQYPDFVGSDEWNDANSNKGNRKGALAKLDELVQDSTITVPSDFKLHFFQDLPASGPGGFHDYQTLLLLPNPDSSSSDTTVDVKVTKKWVDTDGTTEVSAPSGASATFQLKKDGTNEGDAVVLPQDSKWEYTWTGLASGATYTVEETAFTGDGFEQGTVDGDATTGFTATNKKKTSSSDNPTLPTVKTQASPTTIEAATNQTITDTVTLTNLIEGVEYTITGKLVDKETEGAVEATCTPLTFTATAEEATASSVTKEMTFTLDATNLAGKSLVVCETLSWTSDAHGTTKEVKHADLTDAKQTVTVNEASEDTTGELATTIKVAGTDADGEKLLVLPQQSNTVPVVDTIEYTDLIKNATYTVTGTLMLFDKDNTTGKEVATKTEEALKAADTSGTWTINFGTQTLQPNAYYVVFESATLIKDADGNTVKGATPIIHDDIDDLAQAVAVEEVPNITFTHNDVSFNPAEDLTDEDKTKITQPKIGTTASAGGKTATATAAASLTETEAANATSVTDTIAYEGFGQDDTYTVTGTLYKVAMATPSTTTGSSSSTASTTTTTTTNTTPTAVGAPVTMEVSGDKVDKSGKGTWTMTFNSGKLEAGYKYYVQEVVTDSQGNVVASHGDANTPSQCIMVTKATTANNVTGATQTAKTADTATGVALLAALVAAGSAALLLGARRKSHN